MEAVGTSQNPLRVAVIGAGPAGFYVVQHLFAAKGLEARIDMFDRLPTPFGLVRHGVAPDHQKIKNVIAVYHKLAQNPGFRFFGGVEFGSHITMEDLARRYHQVIFATGAQTDRRLGIPGEDLPGSHPATEFVAWYNGHPDYSQCHFDLACERAVVIGVGNVAVDVARILCRSTTELAATDIAPYALDCLEDSHIREVFLVGRRGPAQAAFTNAEIKELGEMEETQASTVTEEVALDPLSRAEVEAAGERVLTQKIEILESYAGRVEVGKRKKLIIRFLLSPVEILEENGRVGGIRLVRNRLEQAPDGSLKARPTGEFETIACGLVFRSVGYHGVPLAGVPFVERAGVIPNLGGRVLTEADAEAPLPGLYAAGWIKRGPSGVIGTNKSDAKETVAAMLEDLRDGRMQRPTETAPDGVNRLLLSRGVHAFSYADWQRLDSLEMGRGKPLGRPRVKITSWEEFRELLKQPVV